MAAGTRCYNHGARSRHIAAQGGPTLAWLAAHWKLALLAVVLGIAVFGGVLALGNHAPAPATAAVAATPPPAPTAAVERRLKVYVTGAVARPGVYTFYGDRRVEDAIAAAGGFQADADRTRVNLAARLRDEEQVYVFRVGEAGAQPMQPLVNLNTATAEELRATGVLSAHQADQVVAYRNQHGPFHSVDDLRRVPIAQTAINKLRPLVTLA